MKKTISIIISLMMFASLVACGGKSDTSENSSVAVQSEAQTSSEASSDAESQEVSEEASTDAESQEASDESTDVESQETSEEASESTASFDSDWAGSEYVMPIPQPPFAHFEVTANGGMYMISSSDAEEMKAFTEADASKYCDELKNIGFTTVHTDGANENKYGEIKYAFAAENAEGVHVELDWGFGGGTNDSEPQCVIVVVLP